MDFAPLTIGLISAGNLVGERSVQIIVSQLGNIDLS